MTIELFQHPWSPPSKAVIFVAKELGIDLKLTTINLGAREHMTPEFLRMNPHHCLPTIKDHSNGLILWESRAIMTYLVNKYSPGHPLYPLDAEERALVDRAMYFEAGTLYPAQAAAFYVQLWGKPIDQEKKVVYEEKLSMLDKSIGGNKYVTGEKKTVADLSLMTTLVAAEAVGADLSPYENVSRWLKNLRAELPYDDANKEMHDGLKAFAASRKQ